MLINMRNKLKNQHGFTLVELMAVIAILGILAALALPKFTSSTTTAKNTKLTADLSTVDSALAMYYANSSSYPADGVTAAKSALVTGATQYLAAWPQDVGSTPADFTYTLNADGTYTVTGKNTSGTAVKSPGSK